MATSLRPHTFRRHILIALALAHVALLPLGCDFGPTLDSLVVTGSELASYPDFHPFRAHYAVRPGETDSLQLEAVASNPNHLISINGSDWEVGSASVDLAGLLPGSDIHVTVSAPTILGGRRTYVVHYLPEGMPEFEITKIGRPTPGLIFLTPRYQLDGELVSYNVMVDNEGVPHWYRKEATWASDLKLQRNGQVTFSTAIGPNEFGREDYEIAFLDEKLEDSHRATTVGLTQTDHHDFLISEEGNYVFISYNTVFRDMTEYGLSDNEEVGDSVIQETTPDGEVIWEWSTWDNVPLDDFTMFFRFPWDYAHVNAIFLTKDNGVIASFRGGSQIYKIDRDTGEVVWRLGGSWSDFEIVGDHLGGFCGQHTAYLDYEGNLSMFDNGVNCLPDSTRNDTGSFARAVAYDLDLENNTATFVWDHSLNGTYSERSFATGSTQPMKTGRTFIGWGTHSSVAATELNRSKEEIFRLSMSAFGRNVRSYRAFRYPGFRVPVDPELPPLPKKERGHGRGHGPFATD